MDWISVKDRLPNDKELRESKSWAFLCCALTPVDGGTVSKKAVVVSYDMFDKRWICKGMIITHWMPLPELSKED